MRRRLVCAAAAALLLGGCGGESEGQALGGWQSQADAACREARSRIVERGRPGDVRDLDRLIDGAVADARAAVQEITAAPLPAGSEARVRPFVDGLKALEPRLEEVLSAQAFSDSTRILDAVDEVHAPTEALSRQARRAGLRDCAPDGFAVRVTDALMTPVFVEDLRRADRKRVAAMRRAQRLPAGSPSAQAAYLRARWGELGAVLGAFGDLYPPEAAAAPLNDCMALVEQAEQLAFELAFAARDGHAAYVEARFHTLARRQAEALERTVRAVGA